MLNLIYSKIVMKYLSRIQKGCLEIELPDGSIVTRGTGPRRAKLHIRSMNFFTHIVRFGDIGFAECYIKEEFTTPDLSQLLTLLADNVDYIGGSRGFTPGILGILAPLNNFKHKLSPNSKKGARKNIQAHYDLPPDFFKIFLDRTMMYSAARYNNDLIDLTEAQIAKLDTLIESLELRHGDHVLEIGTGWGEMACRLAETSNVYVTTITLSKEQYDFARKKVISRGLENRVTVQIIDYRDIEGQFDAIISIEMIEAVGLKYMNSFFERCHDILKPGGRLTLQAITIPDRYFDYYIKKSDFIQKYIFPGGMLPSISLLMNIASKNNNFDLLYFVNQAEDYTATLKQWRQNFENNKDRVLKMGYDENFFRMWNYYFAYCEAGFSTGNIGLARMVMKKPGDAMSLINEKDETISRKGEQDFAREILTM